MALNHVSYTHEREWTPKGAIYLFFVCLKMDCITWSWMWRLHYSLLPNKTLNKMMYVSVKYMFHLSHFVWFMWNSLWYCYWDWYHTIYSQNKTVRYFQRSHWLKKNCQVFFILLKILLDNGNRWKGSHGYRIGDKNSHAPLVLFSNNVVTFTGLLECSIVKTLKPLYNMPYKTFAKGLQINAWE